MTIEIALAQMTREVREVNVAKGFRPAEGGPGGNTFGDYIALLHSEASEALEAYRDHRLGDATGVQVCVDPRCSRFHSSNPRPGDVDRGIVTPCPAGHMNTPKPEGVGSELADVLIRLIDMADVFGVDLAAEYQRKVAYNRTRAFQHGGRTLSDTAS